jgi:hypothetical protein
MRGLVFTHVPTRVVGGETVRGALPRLRTPLGTLHDGARPPLHLHGVMAGPPCLPLTTSRLLLARPNKAPVEPSPCTQPMGCMLARGRCWDTLHRKQKISYRENTIQAKMQSRRRKQRGDERGSPLKISKAYKVRLLSLR